MDRGESDCHELKQDADLAEHPGMPFVHGPAAPHPETSDG
jgi:hypothetical protein